MKHLVELPNNNPWWKAHLWFRRYYYLSREFTYYSERYGKHITASVGRSDGATGAMDICHKCSLIHDELKKIKQWDDGTACTNKQASYVLYDLLIENGHWVRARTWFASTLAWGMVVK